MEPLDRAVRAELGRLGPGEGMADLVAAWPSAVGAVVSRNAWPARLARDGTLHVHASSAAWAHELAHLAPDLLARLREAVPAAAPAALRFAVGPVPEPSSDGMSGAPAPPRAATPEERELAAALAAPVADEELRALVARAAAASLARAASDRPF